MLKNLFTTLKLSIACSVGACIFLSLNSVNAEDVKSTHAIQNFQNGYIDWTSKTISVVGTGTFRENATSQAQARLLAERAAIADGYRQLAEIVNGVRVDSETLVRDAIVESDVIRLKVEGLIKGARRGQKRITADGVVEYELTAPLYGISGLAGAIQLDKHIIKTTIHIKIRSSLSQYHNKYAFLNDKVTDMPMFQISEADLATVTEDDLSKIDKSNCLACHRPHKITEKILLKMKNKQQNPQIAENIEEPIIEQTPTVEETPQIEQTQNYQIQIPEGKITGIIIDAKNQNLTPSMSPAVLDNESKQVYIGNWDIDPDYVINNGIVSYATDIEELKKDSRIGNNPIVVKASSIQSLSNVALSDEDIQKIIEINKKDKFLEKYSVGLIM